MLFADSLQEETEIGDKAVGAVGAELPQNRRVAHDRRAQFAETS